MTVEQYRQMAESLPEKKSYGSMGTLMSGGGSDQYRDVYKRQEYH